MYKLFPEIVFTQMRPCKCVIKFDYDRLCVFRSNAFFGIFVCKQSSCAYFYHFPSLMQKRCSILSNYNYYFVIKALFADEAFKVEGRQ